ncbi:MAG: glycosyltransferase family 2 protein [Planctomycetota bacterium]
MSESQAISIVILSWNTRDLTRACLASIFGEPNTRRVREVIVVDNNSGDGSKEMIRAEFPQVRLLENSENLLYAYPNNQGAELATGRYLCILNSDTEVHPGALDGLADFLERDPAYGLVGPRLVSPDGSTQKCCARFPGLFDAVIHCCSLAFFPPFTWWLAHKRMRFFNHEESRDVPQPMGACFMFRRADYQALGGFDPELSLFFNDVDICRRVWKRGLRIRYLAEFRVLHHQGKSTRKLRRTNLLWGLNSMAYYRRHYGWLGVGAMRFGLFLWRLETLARVRLGRGSKEQRQAQWIEAKEYLRRVLAAPSATSGRVEGLNESRESGAGKTNVGRQ